MYKQNIILCLQVEGPTCVQVGGLINGGGGGTGGLITGI